MGFLAQVLVGLGLYVVGLGVGRHVRVGRVYRGVVGLGGLGRPHFEPNALNRPHRK